MRTILNFLVLLLLVVSVVPGVVTAQTNVGGGITPDIETQDFAPRVWMCDTRLVFDDATAPGRFTNDGEFLVERLNNYAFEGEQILWTVLVWDKNGVEKIEDVFATIGSSQGEGNDIESNCQKIGGVPDGTPLPDVCNAQFLEEDLEEFDSDTMEFYSCIFTVETPLSMYGEYWVTVEAIDLDGLSGTMDENEYWFFNPIVALSIDGDLVFEDVLPGTSTYSDTLLVGNDADEGSGVMMDMFISGTDFFDSSSSGAMCPTSNTLQLWGPGSDSVFGTADDTGFFYFATHGAYSSAFDLEIDAVDADRTCDAEGYCNIEYGVGFNDPSPFYNNAEIIQSGPFIGPYYQPNVLSPGSEMSLTFRLDLPEPCNGDFDTGSIFFWGEAI